MRNKLQPNLENEFILVRPLAESDFEPLFQVANDPKIWEQHPVPTRYKKDEFELFFEDSIKSKGGLVIIDKENDQIIGSSRFKKLDRIDTAIEIGWTFLSRKYWGGKYNSMVKSLMIDHAFNYFDEIIFYVTDSNIRSQKAIEKIGGKKINKELYSSPTENNDLTFWICKEDWRSV